MLIIHPLSTFKTLNFVTQFTQPLMYSPPKTTLLPNSFFNLTVKISLKKSMAVRIEALSYGTTIVMKTTTATKSVHGSISKTRPKGCLETTRRRPKKLSNLIEQYN